MGNCLGSQGDIDYAATARIMENKQPEQPPPQSYRSIPISTGAHSYRNFNDPTPSTDSGSLQYQASAYVPPRKPKKPQLESVPSNRNVNKGLQKNVFAAALDLTSFRLPVFDKSPEEISFLKSSILQNFVFSNLQPAELTTLINAFERCVLPTGTTIIQQGDFGDYFYVIEKGTVGFEVNGKVVGSASSGDTFGELSLLYTAPRAASCLAGSEVVLFRVDQKSFKYVLQTQTESANSDKLELIRNVPFLKELDGANQNRIVDALQPRKFCEGTVLVKKGDVGDALYIIVEGKVSVTDIEVGGETYEDQVLGPGDYFGERALVTEEPRTANCVGATEGLAIIIDKATFTKVLGDYGSVILRAGDKRSLNALKLFERTNIDPYDINALTQLIRDEKKMAGEVFMKEGDEVPATLVFVREGKVKLSSADGSVNKTLDPGSYFGDDMLERDAKENNAQGKPTCVAGFTVTVIEDANLGCLYLEDCREVMDTTIIGKGRKENVFESSLQENVNYEDLSRHAILGQGSFGQVWLVSSTSKGTRRPYALKIQSKFELVQNQQARGVVREKKIMGELQHPFIIKLIGAYQDDQRLFMLLRLVQGGELFNRLSENGYTGIKEDDARFYAAGILEGLTYMHRRNIIYRDLKPENVLIDDLGYPVIVDLGFAKRITDKTYTLCGTPMYIAPEVILNRGHDKGADHWSLGILIYEMICGSTPFYREEMEQIELFKAIAAGEFVFPEGRFSESAEALVLGLLISDPSNRLGSLARGSRDIYDAPWFKPTNFHELRRKEIRAPWMPMIKDALDTSNFDSWDHLEDINDKVDPLLTDEQELVFSDF